MFQKLKPFSLKLKITVIPKDRCHNKRSSFRAYKYTPRHVLLSGDITVFSSEGYCDIDCRQRMNTLTLMSLTGLWSLRSFMKSPAIFFFTHRIDHI